MWEKMRKLIDGTDSIELVEAVSLVVKTKCPNKYLLLDLETNEIYRGANNESSKHWVKINYSFEKDFKKLDPKSTATAVYVREILDAVEDLLKL